MKWYNGVRNTDINARCKVSTAKGHIVKVYDSARCLVRNDNGTEHIQNRSNVMVLR